MTQTPLTLTFTLEGDKLLAVDPLTHIPFTVPLNIDGLKLIYKHLKIQEASFIEEFLDQRQVEREANLILRKEEQIKQLEELF